jgi:hypothetical protein
MNRQMLIITAITILLFVAGCWNIADGIGSIIEYEKQSDLEQLVRVIRMIVGIIAIAGGFWLFSVFH